MVEEPVPQGEQKVIQQREQECLHQSSNSQEFGTAFPGQQARAFESQFGFAVTDGHLDLPAAIVSQDNSPGVFRCSNRFVGQQIPGFASLTGARDDQRQGAVGEIGEPHWQEDDAGLALTTPAGIINHAVLQRAFAPQALPGFEMASIGG